MSRLILARRLTLSIGLCLWCSGCSPWAQSGADEEKDPNYLAGRSRKSAQNYPGAIGAFEKALEVQPRSAAAHLELGLIYYQHLPTNWARAIYHFEKYLELRPKANNADLIRQNIDYCKLALAKEVPYTPNNDLVRKEVEHLARENADLRQQVDELKAQLALRPAIASAASNPSNATNSRPFVSGDVSSNPVVQYAQLAERPAASPPGREPAPPSAGSRTHVVKSRDTFYSLARNYGVKLESLFSANPGMEPTRLRPGQTLVIPPP